MTKVQLLLLPILLWGFHSSAQDQLPPSINLIYAEAGGYGGVGSLNYERIIWSSHKFQIGPRIGLGCNRFKDFRDKFNPDISIPLGLTLAFGNNFKGEIGVGTTYTSTVYAAPGLLPERRNLIHGNALIGMRYQKLGKGPLFRIGYSPIFETFSRLRHWPYLAFGWTL